MNGVPWRVEWRGYVIEWQEGGVISLANFVADVWVARVRILWGSVVIFSWRCIGWLYGIDWRDSAP
ncbi:MAG: hypothetical protein JWL61_5418 [Gemmatimonadetes bacterium]|nr:hypothetical protein [Gemmatimonadota bacterium]